MISTVTKPKSKQELIRSLQKQQIDQIEVFDRYHPSDTKALDKAAKEMMRGAGDVTVILVKTK
ncbi:hypothetical protein JQU17_20180 [Ponticoccus sp. SC2-23]|uniref:hypothetical protein n=1 Tax=Alexandriicola marinus TaxID=2081710 RepID=UPI000FD76BC9|nr:hypothetical protein [Alexandriicola marinus]MBM1222534.1 hypothetical protein [Ponticoccus sp. SC6-9]MBM1227040.1 hypothetical protein [Ponticoccus sp. SC6-15]MBM1231461.1 hypothetical protein [Ponticoccus sp. SC6-38]MBM1236103.1 hypothetical protein [Ponticoccus sp. SC6-45]MBM1240484.1 hypothetical protein [Ponticoccus sp. SC6-49]MBM1245019.1 hypothetical protein [Ponticoccus sp. SC2-64]MBM1249578.1 hypothetical protein [Ponticoccus sp. SC6-42]MBM1253977.1 hypothetical protein [Pontico